MAFNPFQLLRMQQLFGGGNEPTFPEDIGPPPDPMLNNPTVNNSGMPSTGGGGINSIADMISQLYHPQTQNSDRLNSMLNNYPQQSEPGFLRKLSASLIGGVSAIGGHDPTKLQEDILHPGFSDQLKEWNAKIGPTERAAALEKSSNVNERTMAMQTIADKLKQEAEQHKVDKNEIDAKIRQQRADIYEFKAHNPGMKFDFSGPQVKVMDPIKGTVAVYTDGEGNPIETGKMSKMDQMVLGEQQALERINANETNTEHNLGVKHTNTLDEILARGRQAQITKGTPSGNANTNKPLLPSQVTKQQINSANELYNTRPDLRPFIKITGTGFQITPPGKNFLGYANGPTPDQYKEINDKIYGSTGNISPVPSHNINMSPNTKTNQPMSKQQRNTTTGEIRTVYSYDGGITWGPQR